MNEIIDIVEVNVPGLTGDVTPAAIAARDAAISAKNDAETASGQAQASAATAQDAATRAENAAESIDPDMILDRVAGADLVGAIRYPLYIAHRGSALRYPEHSWEAYRASFEAGFTPEADVRALSGGKLVCIHDATTNRTMNLNKSVTATTPEEWRKAKVLPPTDSTWGIGTGLGTPVFFEDYLDEFGGRVVLWPEIKVSGAAATAAIKAITDRNLERSVVVQSSILTVCREAVAAGCHVLYLTNSATPATIVADGIEFVGVSTTATTAYITQCKNAGLKVISYTVNTKAAADAEIARGCDGVFSDDPWEVSREFTEVTKLDLSKGYLPPLIAFARENSGAAQPGNGSQRVAVDNNSLLYMNDETSAYHAALRIGQFGFGISRAVIRLTAQAIKPCAVTSPENTWLFGVYLGRQGQDGAVNEEPNDSQWRLAMVRRNGQKNAYEKRTLTGSTNLLGTVAAPSTPYAKAGGRSAPLDFEVEFTPTSVAIRNLTLNDTDLNASGTSLIIPGAYITLAVNGGYGRIYDVSIEKG